MKKHYPYENTPGFKRTPNYILEAQKQKIVGDELPEKKHRRRRRKKPVEKQEETANIPTQEQPDDFNEPLHDAEEEFKWTDIVRSPDTDFIRKLIEDMELKANSEWVITLNETKTTSHTR